MTIYKIYYTLLSISTAHLFGELCGAGQAVAGVEVLQLVEEALSLHLGVHAPLTDSGCGHACLDQLLAEGVCLGCRLQPVEALGQAFEGGGTRVDAVITINVATKLSSYSMRI